MIFAHFSFVKETAFHSPLNGHVLAAGLLSQTRRSGRLGNRSGQFCSDVMWRNFHKSHAPESDFSSTIGIGTGSSLLYYDYLVHSAFVFWRFAFAKMPGGSRCVVADCNNTAKRSHKTRPRLNWSRCSTSGRRKILNSFCTHWSFYGLLVAFQRELLYFGQCKSTKATKAWINSRHFEKMTEKETIEFARRAETG